MTRKFIKKLVQASYKDSELDSKTVEEIAKRLTRKELKRFIDELRTHERAQTVIIETSDSLEDTTRKALAELYKGKKITEIINKDLILGMRIQNNDTIYDTSLKNKFDTIVRQIQD